MFITSPYSNGLTNFDDIWYGVSLTIDIQASLFLRVMPHQHVNPLNLVIRYFVPFRMQCNMLHNTTLRPIGAGWEPLNSTERREKQAYYKKTLLSNENTSITLFVSKQKLTPRPHAQLSHSLPQCIASLLAALDTTVPARGNATRSNKLG